MAVELQYIKGVGPKLAVTLKKIGLETGEDFLYFFPRTYDDRRRLPSLAQLMPQQINACIGIIQKVEEHTTKTGLTIMKALLSDGKGKLVASWFNQPFMKKVLTPGTLIWVKGKVERHVYSAEFEMAVSEHETTSSQNPQELALGSIMPIYSLTPGLYPHKMRQISKEVLKIELPKVKDPLPLELLTSLSLVSLPQALQEMHFPSHRDTFLKARNRLVFDEFFYFQISLAQKRVRYQHQAIAPVLSVEGPLFARYGASLPYTLTGAQKRVIEEIAQDLARPHPMNRLVQGDVGSGKTEVAVATLLAAVQAGKKGALMAPTEILASQHAYKLKHALAPLGIEVLLLKGKQGSKERNHILETLQQDQPQVVVGTHALIEESVALPHLGVIVIDEQHRFGVVQRARLQKKGESPHSLFMTATPIPRSFMLTCFGDLHKSVIDELPPGRVPPLTFFMTEARIEKVYAHCKEQIDKGFQVYIVYPLVEESEKLDLKSAIEGWEHLKEDVFSQYTVGLIHGKMKPKEKNAVMDAFKAKQVHILVATTVIEVGIDVPNATTMVIWHAERYGLAPLHQLRGRIGRGGNTSWCFLISQKEGSKHNPRLQAMLSTTDGFQIAEYDLKIRGPGDMLGTRQSGMPDFRVADLVRDEAILRAARAAAFRLVREDPALQRREHVLIKTELLKRSLNQDQQKLN